MAYTVYCLKFPNGKRYIGRTKKKPELRWKNGEGYKGSKVYDKISKYGWLNIEHIILAENLTEEEADKLEMKFISEYQTTNLLYGYNRSTGGKCGANGVIREKEDRENISQKVTKLWENPEYRKHMSEAHKGQSPGNKGKPLSEWQKEYLRKINTGKKQSAETVAKRAAKLKGRHHTEEMKKHLSEIRMGIPLSEDHKASLIKAWKFRRLVNSVLGGMT